MSDPSLTKLRMSSTQIEPDRPTLPPGSAIRVHPVPNQVVQMAMADAPLDVKPAPQQYQPQQPQQQNRPQQQPQQQYNPPGVNRSVHFPEQQSYASHPPLPQPSVQTFQNVDNPSTSKITCCCKLKTGLLIIAILTLVSGIISCIYCSAAYGELKSKEEHDQRLYSSYREREERIERENSPEQIERERERERERQRKRQEQYQGDWDERPEERGPYGEKSQLGLGLKRGLPANRFDDRTPRRYTSALDYIRGFSAEALLTIAACSGLDSVFMIIFIVAVANNLKPLCYTCYLIGFILKIISIIVFSSQKYERLINTPEADAMLEESILIVLLLFEAAFRAYEATLVYYFVVKEGPETTGTGAQNPSLVNPETQTLYTPANAGQQYIPYNQPPPSYYNGGYGQQPPYGNQNQGNYTGYY